MKLKLRINGKMLLFILGTTIVVYVSALSYAAFQLRSNSYKNANHIMEAKTIEISNTVQIKLNSYIEAISVLSDMFSNFREYPDENAGDLFSEMLYKLIEKNHNYSAIYTVWEPETVLGNQADLLSSDSAVAVPFQSFFVKSSNEVLEFSAENIDVSVTPEGDIYKLVKSSGMPYIGEPFYYEYKVSGDKVLILRMAVPILKDDTFLGIVGADIPMTYMQQYYSKMRPMGEGKVYITTNSGVYLAHPYNDYFDKKINSYAPDIDALFNVSKSVKEGLKLNFIAVEPVSNEKSLFSIIPIEVGNANSQWSFCLSVPLKTIYKKANRTFSFAVFIGLVGLVIISLVIWGIALSISNPIVKTTRILQELSRGNIRNVKKVKFVFNDEINDMAIGMNMLVEGLNSAALFAQQIGEGYLDIDYKLLGENDALGISLISMQESLKSAKQAEELKRGEDEKRNWVTHGLAKFGEVIRQHNDNMDKFTHNVVQNIVDYVGAAQVAMYVNKQIEDEHREKDTFDLKALMAYGKIVKLDKTFQNGHELLGRVTLENRTIYMEGLPIRYVKLSPGMQDEKRPTNLLITPININENALGVIEILSFDKWEPHQIDFIEKLCENIASVVASVKTNLRTEKLLQQSQYQADELAQHEEEMRQNLEEMEATQEEANKRQDELNSYLKAIKGSIMTAELDLNGRIIDISPAMSLAYGASMDNMRGKFYDAFVAQNKESQDEFREFWEALINSGSGKRMQKFKQRNKEAVLLESYLVIEKEGLNSKVIVVAIDKTREKELNEQLEKEIKKQKSMS